MKFSYDFMMRHHTDNMSVRALAKEKGVHANTLRREMIKAGIPIKTRSESLKVAYSTGQIVARSGFTLTDEHRTQISKANKGKVIGLRNTTNNLIINRAEAMRGRGASGNREAAKKGSKFERILVEKFQALGYNVTPQFVLDSYKIDLMFIKEKIAIEIDGPSHREPIYGEDKLANTMAKDKAKDEAMINKGYSIIRIMDNQQAPTLFNATKVIDFVKETIDLVNKKGRVYRTLEID